MILTSSSSLLDLVISLTSFSGSPSLSFTKSQTRRRGAEKARDRARPLAGDKLLVVMKRKCVLLLSFNCFFIRPRFLSFPFSLLLPSSSSSFPSPSPPSPQLWIKHKGLRVLVIFEGRDAAGKGGVIKKLTAPLNQRGLRIVALAKPTETEKTQWYWQRYLKHLPSAGEIVIFDRSWYNRAGVERVMKWSTDEQVS